MLLMFDIYDRNRVLKYKLCSWYANTCFMYTSENTGGLFLLFVE